MISLTDLLIPLSFLTSMMTVVFGIGGGTVMLLAMTLLLAPAELIFVHGLVQLASNSVRAFLFRRHIDFPSVKIFAVTGVVGLGVGLYFYTTFLQLDPEAIRITVALFILLSLSIRLPALSPKGWGAGGLVSSFLTLFVGATGPLVAAMVRAHLSRREAIIGTLAAMLVFQHGIKAILLGSFTSLMTISPVQIMLMVGAGAAGTFFGKKIGERLLGQQFNTFFTLALACVALLIVYRSLG